jgi:integrase
MLYTLAAYVGFRASELASLTAESFDLESDPPSVTVEAAYSKRRRRDCQPLRQDIADSFRQWLEGKPAGQLLWPGGWWRHGGKMVRVDLKAARIPYRDEHGRVFDFHALRHQFISSLAAAGVHPKICQALARHSTITLTMDNYAHVALYDQTAALEALPSIQPASPKESLAAHGDLWRARTAPGPNQCNSVRFPDNG